MTKQEFDAALNDTLRTMGMYEYEDCALFVKKLAARGRRIVPAEPVAWLVEFRCVAGIDKLLVHRREDAEKQVAPNLIVAIHPLYAVPQPAPPQPVVPEEFEKALKEARDLADQHWQPGKYKDEAFAKLARLYALAAGAAVKVPDGWKLVPVKVTDAMFHAFHAGHAHQDGSFDESYEAMLNAAPEAGS